MTVSLFILLQERTFADALAIRLEREPDMEVVAALDTRALPSRMHVGSRVDVVLLDADLADNAAFRLGQELSQAPKAPGVIFLSHSNDPERIVHAVRVGAAGWVRKDESLDWLIYVIRGVARGETWLPPDQTGEVLRLLMRKSDQDDDSDVQLLATLTGRERDVRVHRTTHLRSLATYCRSIVDSGTRRHLPHGRDGPTTDWGQWAGATGATAPDLDVSPAGMAVRRRGAPPG